MQWWLKMAIFKSVIFKDNFDQCYIGNIGNSERIITSFCKINSEKTSELCDDLELHEFYILDIDQYINTESNTPTPLTIKPISKVSVQSEDLINVELSNLDNDKLLELINSAISKVV